MSLDTTWLQASPYGYQTRVIRDGYTWVVGYWSGVAVVMIAFCLVSVWVARHVRKEDVGAVLLYLGLTIFITWPLALNLGGSKYGKFDHASTDSFHVIERFDNPLRNTFHVSMWPLIFYVLRFGIQVPRVLKDVKDTAPLSNLIPLVHLLGVITMYFFMRRMGKTRLASSGGLILFAYIPIAAVGWATWCYVHRKDRP